MVRSFKEIESLLFMAQNEARLGYRDYSQRPMIWHSHLEGRHARYQNSINHHHIPAVLPPGSRIIHVIDEMMSLSTKAAPHRELLDGCDASCGREDLLTDGIE